MEPIDFASLPKIELHLHLDCSLSFAVVKKLDPSIDLVTYCERFIAPTKCHDLAEYIGFAARQIDLMQTRVALELVTLDLFEQLKTDGIIYAEIRFAPLQHLRGGLTPKEVVEVVNTAVERGIKDTGIAAGLILCTLRHFSEAESMETVQLVDAFRETHVVGFDLAADEAGYPIDNHITAFQYANDKGLPITAHAGEAMGAESVWETLHHFKPQRIGHGVRSVEDKDLLDHLKREGIHLEICPSSNIQTHVVDQLGDHPIDQIYRSGISISINTDCRTISNISLSQEYQRLAAQFGWTKTEFRACNLAAIGAAFAGEDLKQHLRAQILAAY